MLLVNGVHAQPGQHVSGDSHKRRYRLGARKAELSLNTLIQLERSCAPQLIRHPFGWNSPILMADEFHAGGVEARFTKQEVELHGLETAGAKCATNLKEARTWRDDELLVRLWGIRQTWLPRELGSVGFEVPA